MITSLSGFALLFAASSAVGRICLGFDSANASRYIPYVLPGLAGAASGHSEVRLRDHRSRTRCSRCFWWRVLRKRAISAAPMRRPPTSSTSNDGATAIWPCTISTHATPGLDIRCIQRPEATRLQQKLDWLEARGYSLFQEQRAIVRLSMKGLAAAGVAKACGDAAGGNRRILDEGFTDERET